jgi:hypothetical protein
MTRRAGGAHTRDLFEIPQAHTPMPGSMDFRTAVSELISQLLADAHHAGLDRHEVAARASRLSGKDVTKNMLDGYTSPAREEFNCPLWLAPVLEIVCSCTSLANWHASVHGGRLSVGAETIDAEIGRVMREQELAAIRLRDLKDLRRKVR